MFQLILGYFRVNWNRYRPVELKRFMEGATNLWKMPASMVACLRKIVSWNRLKWLKILLTFAGVGDVSFHNKSVFLGTCVRLTSVSTFSSSLRDSEFKCGFLIF